jgi:hypothetical protein
MSIALVGGIEKIDPKIYSSIVYVACFPLELI